MNDIKNIAIIGCSGALGYAFCQHYAGLYPDATIHAFSQSPAKPMPTNVTTHNIHYDDESSIEQAAKLASTGFALDIVIVATGILHNEKLMPEKSLRDLSAEKFQSLFQVNTIFPALVAKHFLPKLQRQKQSLFAVLSARVGSISDNQLGGWYAYRASKAALNMIVKTAALEMKRKNPQAIIVGLHPGTVDSDLSKPFQRNVAANKLFTPEYSVARLTDVMDRLTTSASGQCYAWDGKVIPH